ncbi:AbrB/MazE/SpoVT family DNA-binding domain-containing protein [Acidisoma cladoniae]|uniref:AbrB/MazE/SpoVT family DNA-binding domain-containing protein n=1 Tax=Acidisoma cladoniae TaxID=3040935 RepID=UPI00254C8226|nr:AbrB/MazE/SpoVT family DNA-binding domain-containing protein [Acidisoma sp. PAMC 29798]
MNVQLTKWGNSLGLRIPKSLATRFGLVEGAQLEIEADDDRIVISMPRPRYRIEDLVADLTHEDLAGSFDWGPDEGREIVE